MLGQLVVKLGLDAADFTKGLTKSEADARRAAQKIAKDLEQAEKFAARFGAALGAGLSAAAIAFDQIIKSAADFQDISERIGDSAEAVASLGVAAGTAGTSMETIEQATIRLTKGIAGLDKESESAQRALQALNLPIEEFKRLSPVDQLESVAKALAGFRDGAEKTAVAVALFGRSGAQLLPFLRELGQEGGRQVILTQAQIKAADEYADSQAKLVAQVRQFAQAAATEAIPALTTLGRGLKDAVVEALGLQNATKEMVQQEVRAWAADGAIAIATLAESLIFTARAARAVVGSFETVAAEVDVLLKRTNAPSNKLTGTLGFSPEEAAAAEKDLRDALEARNRIREQADQRYIDLVRKNAATVSEALRAEFSAARQIPVTTFSDARLDKFGPGGPKLPSLPKLTFPPGGSGIDKAMRELEQLRDFVDSLGRKSLGEQIGLDDRTIADLERLDEAARRLNLTTAERARFIDTILNADGKLRREQDEITRAYEKRLESERDLVKSAAEMLSRAQEEAGAIGLSDEARVAYLINLEKERALRETGDANIQRFITGYYDEAAALAANNVARQKAFDAAKRGVESGKRLVANLQAQLGVIGLTAKEQGIYNVNLERAAALVDVLDEAERARINTLYDTAEALVAAIDTQMRWANDAAAINDTINSSFVDNFTALIEGTKSVKDAFKDMADDIVKQINRIAAQKIAESLFGPSGGTGGIGGWFASLFGGGGGGFGFGSLFGFANGTNFAPGGLALVGERGPELVNLPRGAQVIPNHEIRNFNTRGDMIQNINITMPAGTDRRSAAQVAMELAVQLRRHTGRHG